MAFEGFSEGTLAFLGGSRGAQRPRLVRREQARYEREVLERQKAFVDAMGEALAALGASGAVTRNRA